MAVKNHRHITPRQAKWYSDLLRRLEAKHKSIEECWFWTRWEAGRIHRKRSECSACYDSFSVEYRGRGRG